MKKNGLIQFPAIIGGVVPVVNLEGIAPGGIKLSGETLANIYLGKLKKWNDKESAVQLTANGRKANNSADFGDISFVR